MSPSTPTSRPIGEDDLNAYVDGQLERGARKAVEDYLERHPEVATRVASYVSQREGLRRAFAWKATEPVPAGLNLDRLVDARLNRRIALRRYAAVAVLCLSVGSVGGWTVSRLVSASAPPLAPPNGVTRLAGEAVAAHRVFAVDRTHPVELDASKRDDLVRWMTVRLEQPIIIPDLERQGYRFMGGRLVSAERGPAALLMYDDDRGTRLSLYVRPMADPNETTSMALTVRGQVGAWAWAGRGVGYSVSAETAPEALKRTADLVRTQIERRS